MNDKRRDNKGRILRQGELQRNDGKYEYRYEDLNGERRSVYSWKLVETDKIPNGKRKCVALRDMEKAIQRDLDDGINTFAANRMTLNRLFDEYIESKYELKASTRTNYKYMYNKYVREDIGTRNISSIKFSHIKKFYIHLMRDVGFKPNSLENIHTVLHPVITIAVRDGLIRTNPTDGVMADIKKSHDWEKPKRHALTVPQQEAFVGFIKSNYKYRHWLPVFTFMLGTGCRVGEVAGLRWQDCDFQKNIITIDHNLTYRPSEDGSGCTFRISTPKTKAGERIIPMFAAVRDALISERIRQMESGVNQSVVDGYSGFVFSNRFNEILNPHSINRAIERIVRDYNLAESEQAEKESRKPELLPHFSAHNLRHTFCTRLCETETNLKVIQEIMGHADITTTMDIYNEATQELKLQTFEKLEGVINIA